MGVEGPVSSFFQPTTCYANKTNTIVSIGGWIVEFMMQVQDGGAVESGLIPTGFWAGITVGRVTLGFVNELLGERLAVIIYLVLSITLELVFWLVPKFIISAVAVSLIGFFTGLAPETSAHAEHWAYFCFCGEWGCNVSFSFSSYMR
jgi:hypothetical protein